jgi:HEAT repeat protein
MGFDAQNFGIGLLSGWASAYAVYRFRHVIKGLVQSARSQAATAQNAAVRSADSRYIGDLIALCETRHQAGQFVKLSDILIEPRFLPAPELVAPAVEDVLDDVFHVVPRVHDLPYLHAPFNLPTISITDLGSGERALALLGLPGSGRTTALHAIALFSLNRVRFSVPADSVQKLIEEEEAKLPEKERSQRVQARLKLEAQAREKFAEERGVTFQSKDEDARTSVPAFNRLMPLFIDLRWLDFDALNNVEVDPAEPLVRALQANVGRITASTIPGNVYDRLNQGQVLMLIDGFDELPASQQPKAAQWLKAFMRHYAENFFIVTGPARGYGALTEFGLMPVFLRPWQDFDARQLVERWAATAGKRGSGIRAVTPETVEAAKTDLRMLTPQALTLKTWAALVGNGQPDAPESWYRAYLARLMPAKVPADTFVPVLVRMAELQLQEGVITRARMEALGIGGPQTPAPAAPAPTTTAEVNAVETSPPADPLVSLLDAPKASNAKAGAKAASQPKEKEDKSAQQKLLVSLVKSGMLVRCGRDRYIFREAQLAAYLASLSLKDVSFETLYLRASDPAWSSALVYAAMHTSLERLVLARLNAPVDVLHTTFTDMTTWLRFAPQDVEWRGAILKELANLLLAPSQYPLIRERATAALVNANDRSILFILRRAARNANPHLRRLACLAMGAVGDTEAVADLTSLVQDPNGDVQLASALALGAIGTEQALEAMVISFTQDAEPVRKAMAEAFASLPEEGHPVLYDAIRDEDMLLRRAAIAGIRRIRASWALAAIFRTFINENEWYVKSAAEAAFHEIEEARTAGGVHRYTALHDLAWLQDWAIRRGQPMPDHDNARPLLGTALRDEAENIRALAAGTSGQLGHADMVKALYELLRDTKEEVRAASYQALADLQAHLGKVLPAPV